MSKNKSFYLQMVNQIQTAKDNAQSAQIISETFQNLLPLCLPFVRKYADEDLPIVTGIIDAVTKCLIKQMDNMEKYMLEMVLESVSVTTTEISEHKSIYRILFNTDTPDEFEIAVKRSMGDIAKAYVAELDKFQAEDWPMVIGICKCLYLAREEKMSEKDRYLKQQVLTKAYDIAANQWGW